MRAFVCILVKLRWLFKSCKRNYNWCFGVFVVEFSIVLYKVRFFITWNRKILSTFHIVVETIFFSMRRYCFRLCLLNQHHICCERGKCIHKIRFVKRSKTRKFIVHRRLWMHEGQLWSIHLIFRAFG